MDISTGNWFEYLREEVLTEGLRDIGLPEKIVDFIENAMANASEKAKMYAGNQWKAKELTTGYRATVRTQWVDFMRENFEDQIQVQMTGDDDAAAGDIVARTIEPYDTGAVRTTPRATYDEETVNRNKKIAFVVQNVAAAFGKPTGTWRKTFMKAAKALSKAGVESEKVEKVKEWLTKKMFQQFREFYSDYNQLFDWLNDEPTNYELIKNEDDINSAFNTAVQDLESREDPENVIHEFPDVSYWYNLNLSSCTVEGERMGHCGSDSRGVLVSLRKRKEKRKASSSYVTMTWQDEGYGGNYLYQIKGRSNDAPPDEVWDHISWFISNMGVTNVQEDGEHSNDTEGFAEMLNYLQQQNPSVAFTGVVDEEAIQEALNEVEAAYEDDNSSIDASVMGPDEHGGDEGVYIYMNAYCNLQIDLGWPDIVTRDRDFYPAIEAGSGDYDDNFHPIPGNTWGREARDFVSEVEIENIEWDLPGEGEVDWDVRMLTGAQPEGEDINPDAPQTAHLEIEIRMTHSEGASDPDEAKWEFEQFAEQVKENFADAYDEIKENVRRKLVEGEFMGKSAFDRTRNELSETDLRHWHVYEEGGTVEFWFRISQHHASAINNLGGKLGTIPNEFKMWAFDEGQDGHIDGLYSKMFGSAPTGGARGSRIENPQLSQEMAYALKQRYSEFHDGPDTVQQQLALGDQYKQGRRGPPWASVLQSNSRFSIHTESSLNGGRYSTQLVNWKFEIFVDARSPEDRIEAVKDMVKYFNDNPDMVEDAAQDVIGTRFANLKALADTNRDEVLSGKRLGPSLQRIDSMYGAAAAAGSDEWAERSMMAVKWIQDNWDSMDEVEKWVAYYVYILPMALRRLNFARVLPTIEMDDDKNLGKPSTWNEKVKNQLGRLGAWGGTQRDYGGVQRGETQAGSIGEPRPAQESMEQQIDRIDRILKEFAPDIRLYRTEISAIVSAERMKKTKQLEDQLRGLRDVTTVNLLGKTPLIDATQVRYGIKFALRGTESSPAYVKNVLLPLLNSDKVPGIRVDRTRGRGWTTPEEVTPGKSKKTLKENAFSQFGGVAGNLSAKRPASRALPTPALGLDAIAADWQDGGVMSYDVAMDTTDMRYHVMMPVEELLPYISREFRAPKDAFDGMYQNFIKNGAQSPVYVAIGKNRIKITGGEDMVWFAKRSGLEELPVFLSYQSQV